MPLPTAGQLCVVRGCGHSGVAWSPGEFRCLCRYHAESAAACGAIVMWLVPGMSRLPYLPEDAVEDRKNRFDISCHDR